MLETGRRAHASNSLRLKRIDWNTLTVPGKSEDVDIDTFTPETETWFRAKCNLVYQYPSVVLVEKVVVKSDTDMKNKVGQKSTKEPGEPKAATRSGSPPGPWETSYVTRRLELSTEGFLEFLFSDHWEEGCLLRVLKGKLLDNLLHALTQLENYHDVISYTTVAYIYNQSPLLPCIKTTADDQQLRNVEVKMEKILVELDLFCPQERPFKGSGTQAVPDSFGPYRKVPPQSDLLQSWYPVLHSQKVSFFLTPEASKARASCFISSPAQSAGEEKSTGQGGSSLREDESNVPSENKNPDDTNVSPGAKTDDAKRGSHITEYPVGVTQSCETAQNLPLGESIPDTNPTGKVLKVQPMTSIAVSKPPREGSFRIGTSAGPWPADGCADEPATVPQSVGEASNSPSSARETSAGNSSKARIGSAKSARSEGGDDSKTLSHVPSSHERTSAGPWPADGCADEPATVPQSVGEASNSPSSARETSAGNSSKARTGSAKSARSEGGDDSKTLSHVPSSHETKSSGGGLTEVRCNIRGLTQPPPHESCLTPFHMIREPFLQRRHREQSAFPRTQLPSVTHRAEYVFTWGDRWQDDDFLGPREEADGSEVLAPDPFLEKHINANSDATEKSRGSRFASQRQVILASEKKAMNQQEKQRNKKKNDEDDDDDDVSVDEDESESVTLWVDSTREEQFKKDIDCMNSDLVATEKPPLRKRLSIKTRLKLELRARKLSRTQQLYSEPLVGDQKQHNQQPTPEPEPSKDLQLTKKASSPAEKKSKKRPTKGAKKKPRPVNYFFGSPDAPLNVMKKWEKCPDFEEFFQYLGGMSENDISSARGRQRNSKEKLRPGESTDSFCSLDTGGTTSCAVETAVLSKEEDTDKLGSPQEKTAVCKKSALRSAGYKEDTAESTKGSVKRRVSYKEDEIEESKKDLALHKSGHKEKEEMAEPGEKSTVSTLDCKEEETARSGNGSVKLGVSYEDVTREPTKEGKAGYKDGEEMTESTEKPDTHKINYKDGEETAEFGQTRGTSKKSKNTTISGKHNEQMHTYTNSRLELPETEFLTCLSERIMQHLRDGQRDMASRAYTPSGTHLLTEKQETFLQDEGLIVNRMDPWHVSVRFAYLDGGVADSIGVRSDRQRRRDRIYSLLEEGKFILKLNESRLLSLVRQVPKEKRKTKLRSDNTEKRTNNRPGKPRPVYDYAKNKTRGKSSICDDRDAREGETPRGTRGDSEFQSDPYPENSKILLRSNPPLSAEAKQYDTKLSKIMSTDLSRDSDHLQWPDGTGKTLKGSAVKRRQWGRVSQSGPQNGTVTVIDDSEISDSISEQDLFKKMQVGKNFDISNLKSTYSFEKFFGYRMKSVPKYSQRLAKYQHPLTKKKTKDVPKSAEKKKKPPKLPEVEEDKEKEEEVVAEVPTPPMVVGKLKEYRFLQHKDYIPSPMKVEDSQRAEITADELFDYLLLALQVFVVRKERASSSDPFQSMVSITFTRRPAGDPRLGESILHAGSSHRVVTAVCRTLLEK